MTPVVTAAEALDDGNWFGANPKRRYRVKPAQGGMAWVVRRRGRVILRTFMRALPPGLDSDDALRRVWFETAWPTLGPVIRDKLIKAARQAERSKKSTAPAGDTGGGK